MLTFLVPSYSIHSVCSTRRRLSNLPSLFVYEPERSSSSVCIEFGSFCWCRQVLGHLRQRSDRKRVTSSCGTGASGPVAVQSSPIFIFLFCSLTSFLFFLFVGFRLIFVHFPFFHGVSSELV